MSELEKILNDDLLKCEIVETAENDVERGILSSGHMTTHSQ